MKEPRKRERVNVRQERHPRRAGVDASAADSAPLNSQRHQRGVADLGPPRLLSAQAAARHLGVPYTTLRDWVLRGHLPVVRVPDCRRWWFDRRDLDRAVETWKERRDF